MAKPVMEPRARVVIGHPTEVANVVRAADARGQLVSISDPQPVSGQRVRIVLTTLEPVATQPGTVYRPVRVVEPRRRSTRVMLWTGGTVAATAAVVGVVYLVVEALTWLAHHIAYIVGGFVVAVALVALLARLGGPGDGGGSAPHCPGAWHR